MASASVVSARARVLGAVLGLGAVLLLAACSPAAAPAGSFALGVGMTVFSPRARRFVGMDVGDNAASAEAFMKNFRIRYSSLSDPGDSIALRFSRIIPIAAFPSTLVISSGGRIAGRIIGSVSARSLAKLVEIAKTRPPRG